jgi:hypothetical protein
LKNENEKKSKTFWLLESQNVFKKKKSWYIGLFDTFERGKLPSADLRKNNTYVRAAASITQRYNECNTAV